MSGRPAYSIGRRLSLRLALLTMAIVGFVFACSWNAVGMQLRGKHAEEMAFRSGVITKMLANTAASGDEDVIRLKIESYAAMRDGTRLEVRRADGAFVYRDADTAAHTMSEHVRTHRFTIDAPQVAGGRLEGTFSVDFIEDAKLGDKWAAVLVAATLASGALTALGAWWQVRRELRPLQQLARQTERISVDRLDQRLALAGAAAELQPWITQFNALMDRLQAAIEQLDAFNADVAHEMRTPIAALMGHVEVALSRERPNAELRETMAISLEEMQKLSALIDDMLFLSHADQGARARRGAPRSLRELAEQVVEAHEGVLAEAGVAAAVTGEARAAVDDALIRRAVSNLLSNAVRFADRGTTIVVRIAPPAAGEDEACMTVENRGAAIDPQQLPRLFDRFFRADDSARSQCQQQHHGLGLAIVAAVARMHGGRTVASSSGGLTVIGFALCCECGAVSPPAPPTIHDSVPLESRGRTALAGAPGAAAVL
jgi:two-component system, OmpR family, heavy metal sensor histidine kinase CusS